MSDTSINSAHAQLLNRLSEMQQAHYYATARDTLAQAERVIVQQEEEIALSDKLLEQRNALLREIPACPAHGDQCIPHAREWIRQAVQALPATATEASSETGWERRQGMRMSKGWHWSNWQPCTEAEAQRVTGLHSWQVRRTGPCLACAGTGRVPAGGPVCRAEQRGATEWVCDCAAPGPHCKPTAWRGTRVRSDGVTGGRGETFPPADADDAARRNDDLVRLGRSAGK